MFRAFPKLPNGIEYKEKNKDQIILKVYVNVIGTQKALQELNKIFNIDDINIYNEPLEEVIREIYEKN